MKCLTLFVHQAVRDAAVDALREDPDVPGFTLTEAQGHSSKTPEDDPFLATRDLVVGYVPRVRIDVVLPDEAVDVVLERVRGALGRGGTAGAWLVTDAEGFGRL